MLKFVVSLLFITYSSFLYSTSIEEKIGQMIIVGFRESELMNHSAISKQIAAGLVGGVVLYNYDQVLQTFPRNISTPRQLKKLISQLQHLSKKKLFIAIDQEGGLVSRLNAKNGFLETTPAALLGERDAIKTLQESQKTAKFLASVGINLNFAPIVDLNINPNSPIQKKQRSYSSDPFIVIAHTKAMIEGHHHYGILTTLKHFPGHGSSDNDSHLGCVDITETWSSKEIVPYQELITLQKADLIMSAHVFHQGLDPEYPATLSKKIITHLLREEMGYQGVVITDDLQMKAIRNTYDLNESIYLAINAGIDLLLFANNEIYDEEIAPKVIDHIKKMVSQGKIPLKRIEESYQRIQQLKEKSNTLLIH